MIFEVHLGIRREKVSCAQWGLPGFFFAPICCFFRQSFQNVYFVPHFRFNLHWSLFAFLKNNCSHFMYPFHRSACFSSRILPYSNCIFRSAVEYAMYFNTCSQPCPLSNWKTMYTVHSVHCTDHCGTYMYDIKRCSYSRACRAGRVHWLIIQSHFLSSWPGTSHQPAKVDWGGSQWNMYI